MLFIGLFEISEAAQRLSSGGAGGDTQPAPDKVS
jgi:hypothetical protein